MSALELLIVNWQDRANPRAGGAERHLHEVFGRLVARGHRVTLLSSGWRGASRRVEIDGMEVHRAGTRRTFALVAPWYHYRYLAERRFDVVVEDLNKLPLLVPEWTSSPAVLLVHHLFGRVVFRAASPPVAAAVWTAETLLGRAYRGVDVQAVSESTSMDLVRRGVSPERITVIHNGVDTELLKFDAAVRRSEEPLLLYLGRLEQYKRVDAILRAVSAMRSVPDARLAIAGSGSAEPALRALARSLGIASRVDFLGRVDEETKRILLRRAWLHVLLSYKEGWGLTVMEAAACGTPTLGADAPGIRDSVLHGRTGVLVPDVASETVAPQLERLLSDHALRERLSALARERAEALTWDSAADHTEEHLSAVAEGSRPPQAGQWRRYRRRAVAARIPLPRTGCGELPFGAVSYRVTLDIEGHRRVVWAILGARDREGREPCLAIGRGCGRLGEVVVELAGWPSDPRAAIDDAVRAVHGPLTVVHAIGRVSLAASRSECRAMCRAS